jgi:hypothetical protein
MFSCVIRTGHVCGFDYGVEEEYCLVGGMLPTFRRNLQPQFLGYENPQNH